MPNRFAIDKSVIANSLRFHYRDWGGRGWPVLMLHGLNSTSHTWDLVAPLLVEHARLIAVDLRGHGLSDKPETDYDFAALGTDILELAGALELDRPVLLGHDWGARIALWLAAHHSVSIGGLILLDGGMTALNARPWEEVLAEMGPPKLSGLTVDAYREQIVASFPHGIITPAAEAALMANVEIDAEYGIHPRLPREQHIQALRAMWEQSPAALFGQIECPVLIMPVRDADPANRSAQAKAQGVEQALDTIADVEVTWLNDSIHEVPLQHPHRVTEETRRFLAERI